MKKPVKLKCTGRDEWESWYAVNVVYDEKPESQEEALDLFCSGCTVKFMEEAIRFNRCFRVKEVYGDG